MKLGFTGIALGLAVTMSAGAAFADGELQIYNWGDYINPLILKKFNEETGIEVSHDT